MKKIKLFASILFVSAALLSCSKSKSITPTPPTLSNNLDLSVKITLSNFNPADVIIGSIGGSTITDVYSDWTVNGTERKGEPGIELDKEFVNNVVSFNTNGKIYHASLTLSGVAVQGLPFTITVQATQNGKALDPVTIQVVGAATARTIDYPIN